MSDVLILSLLLAALLIGIVLAVGFVGRALEMRGQPVTALLPGSVLLAFAAGLTIMVLGTSSGGGLSGTETFGLALAIVAAGAAVWINIRVAGLVAGCLVTSAQIPIAIGIAWWFFFIRRDKKRRRY